MSGAVGDEVAEGISRVIAPDAIVVGVHLEDVFRAIGVVLEGGQAINEPGAAAMDEEGGPDAGIGIAEGLMDGGPAVDAVPIRRAEVNSEIVVLTGDGGAEAIAGEDVISGDDAAESDGVSADRLKEDVVALEHGSDGFGMTLRDPFPGGVFIHDAEVAIGVPAPEEKDGVVIEAVIEGGEPFDIADDVETVHDVMVAAEGGEELAGGNIPIAMKPGAALPAGEAFEDAAVIRVVEGVVMNGGRDEECCGLRVYG